MSDFDRLTRALDRFLPGSARKVVEAARTFRDGAELLGAALDVIDVTEETARSVATRIRNRRQIENAVEGDAEVRSQAVRPQEPIPAVPPTQRVTVKVERSGGQR